MQRDCLWQAGLIGPTTQRSPSQSSLGWLTLIFLSLLSSRVWQHLYILTTAFSEIKWKIENEHCVLHLSASARVSGSAKRLSVTIRPEEGKHTSFFFFFFFSTQTTVCRRPCQFETDYEKFVCTLARNICWSYSQTKFHSLIQMEKKSCELTDSSNSVFSLPLIKRFCLSSRVSGENIIIADIMTKRVENHWGNGGIQGDKQVSGCCVYLLLASLYPHAQQVTYTRYLTWILEDTTACGVFKVQPHRPHRLMALWK